MAPPSSEIHVAVDLTVLTLRDGALNVLLIQREDDPHRGAWALPGGFIQHGEDLEAAAYRVLSDEAEVGREAIVRHRHVGVGDKRRKVGRCLLVLLQVLLKGVVGEQAARLLKRRRLREGR